MQLLELFQKSNLSHFLTQELTHLKLTTIKNITNKIEEVNQGSIFVSIVGKNISGNKFIEEAIKKKATLIIVENKSNVLLDYPSLNNFSNLNPLPILEVVDTKAIFSILMFNFYLPKLNAKVIAVTGTNGKSSTVFFINQFLKLLNYSTMIVGTLGIFINGKKVSDSLTTPDAKTLIPFLQIAVKENINYIIIEASSHGLDQKRILGLNIIAAGFTNLTQDHLDYHKNITDYYLVKKTLFSKFLSKQGVSVINVDDKFGNTLQKDLIFLKNKIITYGFKSNDFQIISIESKSHQQVVNFFYNSKYYQFTVNLLGRFQVYNIICSMLLIIASNKDVSITTLIPLCEKIKSVLGRLEYIGSYKEGLVYVDYAHTPNGLEEVLLNLREHCDGKLKVVFGCGGNRDISKRKIMGSIASKLADELYITDDNPRDEDPLTIRNQIIEGLKPKTIYYSLEREDAIKKSIESLNKGDILVIAGKGHETTQILKNNQQIYFSDIALSLDILKVLNSKSKDFSQNQVIQDKSKDNSNIHINDKSKNISSFTQTKINSSPQNINPKNPHQLKMDTLKPQLKDPQKYNTSKQLQFAKNYNFDEEFLSKALKVDIKFSVKFNHISIDTRSIQKDSLFVALDGKNKGSSYVVEAFQKGAVIALVNIKDKSFLPNDLPIIYVQNTELALKELAIYFRQQLTFPIIGITGSIGKTSTKDMISHLLSKKFIISKTFANFNNHLGLPVSILSSNPRSKYGVFEIGMSKKGEIKDLSSILKPSIAIITAVEAAHSEFFNNIHEIASEKAEIIQSLSVNDILILNKDNKFCDFFINIANKNNIKNIYTFGENTKSDFHLAEFNITKNNQLSYNSNVKAIIKGEKYNYTLNNTIYKHQALISVLSLGLLSILNLNIKDYLPYLSTYDLTIGRGNLVISSINKNQILLINDSYNSSIESMIKGLLSLTSLTLNRKVLVLGDILEISNSILEHLSLAEPIIKVKPSYVLTIGSSMKRLTSHLKFKKVDFIVENFTNIDDLQSYLDRIILKNDIVFIKGSHGSNVYQIANKYNKT